VSCLEHGLPGFRGSSKLKKGGSHHCCNSSTTVSWDSARLIMMWHVLALQAAKEVSQALSLNYPSSQDMVAASGYERPLDRWARFLRNRALLTGLAILSAERTQCTLYLLADCGITARRRLLTVAALHPKCSHYQTAAIMLPTCAPRFLEPLAHAAQLRGVAPQQLTMLCFCWSAPGTARVGRCGLSTCRSECLPDKLCARHLRHWD
jgi:hypothetical protein